MENKALVISAQEFEKVISKFLDSLKDKKIINEYMLNSNNRSVTVLFNSDAEIPESKEDVISKGLFRNDAAILKDLGYEDVDLKTVILPMISTHEDGDKVTINY